MKIRRSPRRGMTIIELLVAMGLFFVISTITFVLYNDAQAIMQRSTARQDSRQAERNAVERITPFLSGAYVPPINGVSTFYENPNTPYPAGGSASDFLSNVGPGTDSVIFYAAGDLIDAAEPLSPVVTWTFGQYSPTAGPKLYEIRLDPDAVGYLGYANDPQASYQPDQPAVAGGAPPLVLRTLVLREMYIPDHSQPYSSIQYMVPPSGALTSPSGSALPAPTTPTRILARNLSDARFYVAPSGGGIALNVYAQDREGTANKARARTITTSSFNTVLYNLQGK